MRISDWSSDVCSSDLVGAFIEEGRPDLGGGLVTEPLAVERLEDGGGLGRLKSPVGSGPRFGWAEQRWASVAVVGGTAASAGGAAGAPAKHGGQLLDAGGEDHVSLSSVAARCEGSSKRDWKGVGLGKRA